MSALGHVGTAFVTVFPAELPDKTMIATVVLTTRYRRPGLVWLGAAAGFTVHVVIAVAAGSLFALTGGPRRPGAAALFATGAVILWRTADEPATVDDGIPVPVTTGRQVVVASAALILVAEWGDLTQLATAGWQRTADPLFIGLGALAALWCVAALAATGGAALTRVLPVHLLRRIAAVVFLLLAVVSIVELVR
jgi:putative Ca2+/H+ antiporter (TMEM165/GDT1 family)